MIALEKKYSTDKGAVSDVARDPSKPQGSSFKKAIICNISDAIRKTFGNVRRILNASPSTNKS